LKKLNRTDEPSTDPASEANEEAESDGGG
jgi:hypothetical protein